MIGDPGDLITIPSIFNYIAKGISTYVPFTFYNLVLIYYRSGGQSQNFYNNT